MSISYTAKIYPNVTLEEGVVVEDFCIIGSPPSFGEVLPTVIGKGSVIRSHTVIYSGNIIGDNFKTGNKVNIRENNKIGCNVSVGTLSNIEHSTNIEDDVRIHSQVFIPEFSKLERGCWVGPKVVLTNAKYPNAVNTKENLSGPIIAKNAIIGANVTILPGVKVGGSAIVGAGAVVVKDLEPFSVYVGNPAQKIKEIDAISEYKNDSSL